MMNGLALMLVVLTVATAASAQTTTTVKGDAAAWGEVSTAWQALANLKSYRMRMVPAPGPQGAGMANRPAPRAQGGSMISIVSEVVNPGRLRLIVDVPEMLTIETIKVDKELRRRITVKGEMAEAIKAQPSLADQIFGGGIWSIVGAVLDPVGFITGVVTNIVMSAMIQNMMPKVVTKFGVWTCEEGGETQASSPGSSLSEVSVARLPESSIDGAKVRAYDVEMGGVHNGQTSAYHLHVYVLSDRPMLRRMEMVNPDGTLQGTMEYSDFDAPIVIELPKCD